MLVMLILAASPAHADANNYLAGPILGVAWGRGDATLLVGVEGGVGRSMTHDSLPWRFNGGIQHRARELYGYVEFAPWYFVGGSLGLGIGTDSGLTGLVGLWEGAPLVYPGCNERGAVVSISVGYRYTGVHELYIAPKAGLETEPFCLGH